MLEELKAEYQEALAAKNMAQKLSFITSLLDCESKECIDFHFELIQKGNKSQFANMIRFSLRKRGSVIVPILIEHAKNDQSPKMQADAIQTLGNLRRKEAIPLIKTKLSSPVPDVRYASIISLGWMGEIKEAEFLEGHYKVEQDAVLRGYCATALRQIFLTNKSLKDRLLEGFRRNMLLEHHEDAQRCIILSTQTIASVSLGLRESTRTGKVTGDVEKAWKKLITFFANAQSL